VTIQWREALRVGDPQIDSDHQHLIDLINHFEAAISGHIDHRKVAVVLLGLVEYTGQHFQREEAIQRRIRYTYGEAHCKQHRDVLHQLNELLHEYTKSKGDVRDRMVVEMADFLKHWLIDHIIESDLRMRPFIQKMQHEQEDAAKRRAAAISASLSPK